MTETTTAPPPATVKQIAYLIGLIGRHVTDIALPDVLNAEEASELIETIKATPVKARHTTETGYYAYNGQVYAVVNRQSGPGVYAEILRVKEGQPPRWKFVPGMVGQLRPEYRITADDAPLHDLFAAHPHLALEI